MSSSSYKTKDALSVMVNKKEVEEQRIFSTYDNTRQCKFNIFKTHTRSYR